MSEHDLEELQESAEHGREHKSLAPVSLTMAILAVLVAISGLLGHRAHTEEGLLQNRASDQWAYYQAKNIRRSLDEHFVDNLALLKSVDPSAAETVRHKWESNADRYREEQKEIDAKARELEHEVQLESRRADRFDFGESLLEIALVITSITMLTTRREFWFAGIALGLAGVCAALSSLLVH